ncbi:hypothetical protein FisN_5Lh461 [Fistulifera solaris]|uniref:Multidrug resistance protein, MATE family n=1 Tax=Fistulifera solaris TaxID=1519565 RepID=A0A1Z5KGD2_FISSO|nr:hypothetical protein FisN_5Lh461 [Fistulifera solaris]|eukprot:GAX25364.1 hypothetical protein FisN_5Lh461 [Fistulifera solaris]
MLFVSLIFLLLPSLQQSYVPSLRRTTLIRYKSLHQPLPSRSLLTTSIATAQDDSDHSALAQEKKELTKDFLKIGVPALLQLAAEPLAAIVDTAYLGRLSPAILGGAGVAVSAQYAVSKLYNDPLLRTSISLVAASSEDENQSLAVSSALLLAGSVGIIQMLVFFLFARAITQGMGVGPASPMWFSAVSYLQVRALGTPAATLWLVTNGIFRGLGDTRTPLIYSLLFTLLNVVFDPFFIFVAGWGAAGAAAGTALAQYIALVPLMLSLNRKVPINIVKQFAQLKTSLQQYLKAGGLVMFRTVAKVLAYSVCSRQAALLGTVPAAAYNLTFQLGFATTQICEAVAVAVQTLMARQISQKKPKRELVRHLINSSTIFGGVVATTLSLFTWFGRANVLKGLTTNIAVQQAALAVFPAVLLTQVLKGLAYPVNGILMGGLDWVFSMTAMWVANVVCVGMITLLAANGATA